MRGLSAIETAALILAGVFIVVGAISMIHPTASFVPHATERYVGTDAPLEAGEHVSEKRARIYGAGSVVFGAASVWFVFYRRAR